MGGRAMARLIAATTFPIVIQNILDAAVNMADVVMVNAVSQEAMSAVSLASQAGTVIFMFFFGIGTGMTMLGAQYWGRKDTNTIEKVQGIALRFTLLLGLFMMALCLLVPEFLIRIYSSDELLVEKGAVYLRIWSFVILPWGISTVYLSSIRSTGRVAVCTAVETAALLLNVALNALFLFVFHMEVAGVALATVLSRTAELVICCILSSKSPDVRIRLHPIIEKHPALSRDFTRMCLPAIGNDLIWGIAFSVYTAVLGHLSSDAVAANAIVGVIRNLGCVLCYGLGSATGILLGQLLGAGKREEAIRFSHVMLRLSVAAGALGGLLVAASIPIVTPRANLTDAARDYLRFMLTVNIFYIMGTAVNTTLIVGVFRSGGDSRFGFICDTVDMWGWGVPVTLLAAFVLRLDVKLVYLVMCTDEFVKWPWVFRHYYSMKWAQNITRDDIDRTDV